MVEIQTISLENPKHLWVKLQKQKVCQFAQDAPKHTQGANGYDRKLNFDTNIFIGKH